MKNWFIRTIQSQQGALNAPVQVEEETAMEIAPSPVKTQPEVSPPQASPVAVSSPQGSQSTGKIHNIKEVESYIMSRLHDQDANLDPIWFGDNEIEYIDDNNQKQTGIARAVLMTTGQYLATESGMSEGQAEQFVATLQGDRGDDIPSPGRQQEKDVNKDNALVHQFRSSDLSEQFASQLLEKGSSNHIYTTAVGDSIETAFGLSNSGQDNALRFFGEHGWEFLPNEYRQKILNHIQMDDSQVPDTPTKDKGRRVFSSQVMAAITELGLTDLVHYRLSELLELASSPDKFQEYSQMDQELSSTSHEQLVEALFNRFEKQVASTVSSQSRRYENRGGSNSGKMFSSDLNENAIAGDRGQGSTGDSERPDTNVRFDDEEDEKEEDSLEVIIQRDLGKLSSNIELLGDDISRYLIHGASRLNLNPNSIQRGEVSEDWPEGKPDYPKNKKAYELSVAVQAFTKALSRTFAQWANPAESASFRKNILNRAYEQLRLNANKHREVEGKPKIERNWQLRKEYGDLSRSHYFNRPPETPTLGDNGLEEAQNHPEWGEDVKMFTSNNGENGNGGYRIDSVINNSWPTGGNNTAVTQSLFSEVVNELTEGAGAGQFDKPSKLQNSTHFVLPFLLLPEVRSRYGEVTIRAFTNLMPARPKSFFEGKGSSGGKYTTLMMAARGELHNLPHEMQNSYKQPMKPTTWESSISEIRKAQDVARLNLSLPVTRKIWEQNSQMIEKFQNIISKMVLLKMASSDVQPIYDKIAELKSMNDKLIKISKIDTIEWFRG